MDSDYVASSTEDDDATNAKAAQAKADALFAKLGVPRSERRSLIAAMKGGKSGAALTGMPSAANSGTQDAAITTGAAALLEKLTN